MRNFIIYTLLLLVIAFPAHAVTEDKSGAVGAGGDRTFSVDEIWGGLKGVFDIKADAKKQDEKPEGKKLIHAKRLDGDLKEKGRSPPAPTAPLLSSVTA